MDINNPAPATLPIIEPVIDPEAPATLPIIEPIPLIIPIINEEPASPSVLCLSMVPDLGAQVIDLGLFASIEPRLLDAMSNLVTIHYGPNMDPKLLSTVLPNRYLNLFLPQGSTIPVRDLNLSPKAQLFIHYLDALTIGPTDEPFFLWREGCEPFTFDSLAGLSFRGQPMYDGRYSYLKVYMPERQPIDCDAIPPPRIIPNATTPPLDLLKHYLDLANAGRATTRTMLQDMLITEPRTANSQHSSLCHRSQPRVLVWSCSNLNHRHQPYARPQAQSQLDPNPLPHALPYAQSPSQFGSLPLTDPFASVTRVSISSGLGSPSVPVLPVHEALYPLRLPLPPQQPIQPLTVQYYQKLCASSIQNDRAARVEEEGRAIVGAIDNLIKSASAHHTLQNGFAYTYTPKRSEYICDLIAFLTKYLPCCKITTKLVVGSTNHQIIFTNKVMPHPGVTMTAIPRPE